MAFECDENDGLYHDVNIVSVDSPDTAPSGGTSTITVETEVKNCSGFSRDVRVRIDDVGVIDTYSVPTGERQASTATATVTGSYGGGVRIDTKLTAGGYDQTSWDQEDFEYINIVLDDGGDGGGDGVIGTSEAEVTSITATSTAPATIEAEAVVTNTATAGVGNTLSPTVEISINGGAAVASETVTIKPGESATVAAEFADTPTGSEIQVCGEVV